VCRFMCLFLFTCDVQSCLSVTLGVKRREELSCKCIAGRAFSLVANEALSQLSYTPSDSTG
jgi:hypothetical protein